MKTLYIECAMGAAGDMLAASLLELIDDRERFLRRVNSLGIDGVRVSVEPSVKCGITGTRYVVMVGGEEEQSVDFDPSRGSDENGHNRGQIQVRAHDHSHEHDHEHDHEHEHGHYHSHEHGHAGLGEISLIVERLDLSEKVKADVMAVYTLIAKAEASAHGRDVSQVHFHEVGAMDAIADIVSVCLLMEEINPGRVVVSPVHVGSGMVRCAHGILPVPAPATAHILAGVPIYGGRIRGELCTPTGAALLKHFANEFGDMPVMIPEKVGYGMGKKNFEAANCVRVFVGEKSSALGPNGEIAELSCNLDDMTGEQLGFALEVLFEAGALDVFTLPITMKKSRPGFLFTCICKPEDADRMAALMLRHTTTFGVRRKIMERYMLDRKISEGEIRVKSGEGYGVKKAKKEYEDLAKLARQSGKSLFEEE